LPAIVVLIIGTTVAGADFILLLVALLKSNEIFIKQHYEFERERLRAQPQALPIMTETTVIEPEAAAAADVTPEQALEPLVEELDLIRVKDAHAAAVHQEEVRVALISTGVPDTLVEHPAFTDRLEPTFAAGAGAVVNEPICTAAVGFVAAIAPAARILPITVFDSSFVTHDEWILEGLDAAVEWQPDVIVLDFGGGTPSEAISRAIRRSADQIVFVAPAGNEGKPQESWPASEPNVLAVAAADNLGGLASFSSYGRGVRLAAPGLSLRSLVGVRDGQLAFGELSGTSFAADITAAVAALALSVKRMTPRELGKALYDRGRPVTSRRSIRLIDAARLMENIGSGTE
jgi:subtilisin family serine protease